MTTDSGYMGATASVNQWSRILGVSLRPWSGHSPALLIIRSVIQIVIFGILIGILFGLRGEVNNSPEALALLGTFLFLMILSFIGLILVAFAQLAVGVIDLVPRQKVSGVVERIESRKMGDVLPYFVQQMVFNRNPNRMDRRRSRTELVLRTDKGVRQWTVRNSKVRRQLQVGQTVTITVSPLIGYVAGVEVGRL
ncbi:hypothetical protein CFAEC_11215 [Corynebacterium faecale]|uniref:hypothetical protein n=1 Tax=Corynebacterium faecale TaxID=1758466 RepID=UPI0025B28683|nr:hypothetical protein [Corynebacterium faecale]WJY93042.1 hypothetical protein CFAEC_11215 [Corynebacterium faecale]